MFYHTTQQTTTEGAYADLNGDGIFKYFRQIFKRKPYYRCYLLNLVSIIKNFDAAFNLRKK
jgi:hypothetical protein